MAKRIFSFPIYTMLLALLCMTMPALADNVDLASAQPDFNRPAALSISEFNSNTRIFTFELRENGAFEERFTSEFCSFCGLQPENFRFAYVDWFWFHDFDGRDFRDFDRHRWDVEFNWKKHPRSVPEPSSLTLLGVGVLGVAFSLKKRLRA